MSPIAQLHVGCKIPGLEIFEDPNHSKFEATFVARGQLPSGCGTMQMKLQNGIPFPSLFSKKSLEPERKLSGQARKPCISKESPIRFKVSALYSLWSTAFYSKSFGWW